MRNNLGEPARLKVVLTLCSGVLMISLGAVKWVESGQQAISKKQQELCERVKAVEVKVEHIQKDVDKMHSDMSDGFDRVVDTIDRYHRTHNPGDPVE